MAIAGARWPGRVAVCSGEVSSRVLAQLVYDAFGNVLRLDEYVPYSPLRLAHKGLFFDRLDAPTVDEYGVEIVRTEVDAHALYHVRNRNYSPTFGRWNQKDPNASAQPVIDSAGWYHGVAPSAVDITFSHENLFGDGSNLFEYVGGNALVNSDPTGLVMWGDWSDTLGVGAEAFGIAWGVVDTYQFILEEGVDWAMNWEADDGEILELAGIASRLGDEVGGEVDDAAGVYAPLIAGTLDSLKKLGRAGQKALKIAGSGSKRFQKWLASGPPDTVVYGLISQKTGKCDYIGITKNAAKRGSAHDRKPVVLTPGLPRNVARAVETALILKYRALLGNDILSVGPRNKNKVYSFALQFAAPIVSRVVSTFKAYF